MIITTTATPLPSQCSSYTIDSDSTRNTGFSSNSTCDSGVFGTSGVWIRFASPAGTIIPTSIPAYYSCGTDEPGWYSGAYSSTVGSTITGTICYNWASNTCYLSNSIQITHCGAYYVFQLVDPPQCNLRYCAV